MKGNTDRRTPVTPVVSEPEVAVLASAASGVKDRVFLFDCQSCGHKHRMTVQPCPSCGGRGGWTPQPVSERVANDCYEDYDCDGCVAYRDHQR